MFLLYFIGYRPIAYLIQEKLIFCLLKNFLLFYFRDCFLSQSTLRNELVKIENKIASAISIVQRFTNRRPKKAYFMGLKSLSQQTQTLLETSK